MNKIINIFSVKPSVSTQSSQASPVKEIDSNRTTLDFKLASEKRAHDRAIKSILQKASQLGW